MSVLVLCVYSAPACAPCCCPGTAEFNSSISGMRLVHLTPSSRSLGNCNSDVREVTQSFPEDRLCAKQPFSLQEQPSELLQSCCVPALSPPGTCTACYLTDLCSEVARPGVVSAEKNLKHKVLLRSSRRALQTVTIFF